MQVGGTIEDNEISGSSGIGIWSSETDALVRRNLVHDNAGHGIAVFLGQVVENVTYENGGDGISIGPFFDESSRPREEGIAAERLVIGNTSIGNRGHGIDMTRAYFFRIERNISAYNDSAGIVCGGGAYSTFLCNVVNKNVIGAILGDCEAELGKNGNASLDPLFCDPEARDFRLQLESPCAPKNSQGCGLIGALPATCGSPLPMTEKGTSRRKDAATIQTTWGAIKAAFGDR